MGASRDSFDSEKRGFVAVLSSQHSREEAVRVRKYTPRLFS